MTRDPHQFVLRRTAEREWVILDDSYPPADDRHRVARISETLDGDVTVEWMQSVPLPTRHISPRAVVQDLRIWVGRRPSERPVPIPHRPPVHS